MACLVDPLGAGVSISIMVSSNDQRSVSSLYDWLCGEDELRGQVSLTRGTPRPDEMGALANIITVAIGSGGAATVLIGSLTTWVTQRRNAEVTLKITSRAGRVVEINARGAADVVALIKSAVDGVNELK
jgi:hypothetical protein